MKMGYLLKEALKILCGLNQWSYAVFWKFGCQNPKLLIWEEYFYEPVCYSNHPGVSGIANMEPGFDSWDTWVSPEASASQPTPPRGSKVHMLVNKMMMENHVNVVGEGLVGRAAFTGNHQWILWENYSGVAHPPEVLKEVYQQVLAGVQTVAVIPVLPHGVVQLGSCLAILENLGFVNEVKTLIRNLGCVPGVLLSDNYATKEAAPNTGLPMYPGKALSMDSSTGSDVMSSIPFTGSGNNQVNSTQTAGFVGQNSHSLTGQIVDSLKSTAATFQDSNISQDLGKNHDKLSQAKILSLPKPNFPSIGQPVNGVTKAEVIPSHPRAWLNQQTSLYSPRSTSEQQSSISSLAASHGSSRLLEPRILTDVGFQIQTDSHLTVSDGFTMPPLRTNTCLISGSHEASVMAQTVKVSELVKDVNSHVETVLDVDSLQDASRSFNKSLPRMNPTGDGFLDASSSKTEESSSHMMENLATDLLQPYGSVSGHQSDNIGVKTELNKKEGLGNDLFRGISIQPSQHENHMKLSQRIPGSSHGDEKREYDAKSSRPKENSKYKNACVQHQSGDDLFDILGVDYRNKLLNGNRNDSPNNGSCPNAQDYNNRSTSLTSHDAASDLYSVNQGTSESGIFSVTSSDNLLDAVVSRVSSIKQNLDDNVSCKTTLTNNSSGLDTKRFYSRAGVSDQMQGEFFDFPKSLLKAGALGSCSLKSVSCKDNSGTYSQSSSIYGSQISSWVEHSHDIKQSSSVSTAYSTKPDEMSKPNRKRLKPGENPRPRPKDRQMIQDRVKELREIVPNAAKCSIDALLERTIKHMLFLQSVTKHADKLKQTGESKILSKEGGLLIKDNYEGGATWAYEVGSQSMVCPIIVEDLNQPRQMLVEMLCEERGLFLEIADIIRGLGLTILKGVMETRNDKIWARFVVEANRDVTRMEIFISLVRLLEQNAKSGATTTNGVDNDAVLAHQFHQATSIPATGKPCGLQ